MHKPVDQINCRNIDASPEKNHNVGDKVQVARGDHYWKFQDHHYLHSQTIDTDHSESEINH
jgi:hypothetical protein